MVQSRTFPGLARALGIAGATAAIVIGMPASALAAEGNIDHVEATPGKLQVLYSLPETDAAADLGSLAVTFAGERLEAKAVLASDAEDSVRRTAILAIDTSDSMKQGGRFEEAKRAADAFLTSAPDDLYIGIVTFAGEVTLGQAPSLDRAQSRTVLDGLSLSRGTRLYEGIQQAVEASGDEGQRSVVVLSDGRDTTQTQLSEVTKAVNDADVKVDVVALEQTGSDEEILGRIATAGNGEVINASDPKALTGVFASEAQTLAKQILISATVPDEVASAEGTLELAIDAGGETYTDSAFVAVQAGNVGPPASSDLKPAEHVGLTISSGLMIGGVVALGMGLLVLLAGLMGGFGKKDTSLEDRIHAYTPRGSRKAASKSSSSGQGMTAQAVGVAQKALESNRGLESVLGDRLEAAGMALKPAEWLLLHVGIAFTAAALGFLLGSGGLLATVAMLLAGLFIPWFYLSMKSGRRLRAFNGQLAETLQMLAGSLQAGLSMAQSLDTVVREGQDPIANEFRRALVETRLGVSIEDALESLAVRMESDDFKWTVMAIRIQREVGGNLAELLLSVAATMRERDYLRRQVKALSAEGRFSAYILLALPPGVLLYEVSTNGAYVAPLFSTTIGWLMLGTMGFLMVLGAFTMKKLIKLDV